MGNMKKKLRLLEIFNDLNEGKILTKKELCIRYECSEKSIQRDMADLKHSFANTIEYDKQKKGYRLPRKESDNLNQNDIYVLLKILFSSKAFCKEEMNHFASCLNHLCDNQLAQEINDELFYYKNPTHTGQLLTIIEDFYGAMKMCRKVKLTYKRQDHKEVTHTICPVNIIFNEYYFYLLAYMDDLTKPFPAVFRMSRIVHYEILVEDFYKDYGERVKDGEYKKRIQYMYQGNLIHIKFRFFGDSLDAVLDRIPTATLIQKKQNDYILEAEVYNKGIVMWLLSQQQFLEVLEPKSLRDKMKETILAMSKLY